MDLSFWVELLIKLAIALALYVIIARIISAFIPPSRISNRIAGFCLALISAIFFAYKYVNILNLSPDSPAWVGFLIFGIGLYMNIILAKKIFSSKNRRERSIYYYDGPEQITRPVATRPITTRPGQQTIRRRR